MTANSPSEYSANHASCSAAPGMPSVEAAQRERDEARQIVRDIYWMALRYADGHQALRTSDGGKDG